MCSYMLRVYPSMCFSSANSWLVGWLRLVTIPVDDGLSPKVARSAYQIAYIHPSIHGSQQGHGFTVGAAVEGSTEVTEESLFLTSTTPPL